jgi:Ca2+/Na+ antiporter
MATIAPSSPGYVDVEDPQPETAVVEPFVDQNFQPSQPSPPTSNPSSRIDLVSSVLGSEIDWLSENIKGFNSSDLALAVSTLDGSKKKLADLLITIEAENAAAAAATEAAAAAKAATEISAQPSFASRDRMLLNAPPTRARKLQHASSWVKAESVDDALVLLAAERERQREIIRAGFDINSKRILVWDVTFQSALLQTVSILAKMLAVVASLSLVGKVAVATLKHQVQGLTVEISAIEQYGAGNYSLGNLPFDFVDTHEIERSKRLEITCVAGVNFFWLLVVLTVIFLVGGIPMRKTWRFVPAQLAAGCLPAVYYATGGSPVSSLVWVVVTCLACAFSIALLPDVAQRFREKNALDLELIEAVQRKATREGRLVEKQDEKEKTVRDRLRAGVLGALPVLLTIATIVFYTIVVFWFWRLSDSTVWKIAVSVVALAVKVVGNKSQLVLISLTRPPTWVADGMMFGYEYSTAMLCRILQLTIPDKNAAQLMSLSSALVEMGTRVMFYNLFLKAGMQAGRMDDVQKRRYRKWGHLRVQDGSNDMVVEYVSSIVATMILIDLAPTGSFLFTGTTSTDQILSVCFFQLGPEIILDFYCTFMEVFGGLAMLHHEYWSIGNLHGGGLSNFVKGNLLKLVEMIAITFLVLVAALK